MAPITTWEDAVRSLILDGSQRELVRSCYFDPPIHAAAQRFWSSDEWAAVREVIGPPTGRALDLGAGNGIVSFALATDGWETVALEPDRSDLVGSGAIRLLASQAKIPLSVIEGFGEAIPVQEASFELVLARQVLHHASDLDACAAEIARVLKPGGTLLAYRDHVVDGPQQLTAFLQGHPLHRLYGGENAHPERVYRDALVRGGLVVERTWRHFDAAFNYAPRSARDVVEEALTRAIPGRLPRGLASVCASDVVFPAVGRAMSSIDRRPGRSVGFLARKPG